MKKGLVLEGGGMRGMFTCGILDVLLERGVQFDGAVGVSAGAAFGCNYKSRQVGRALRYNCRFAADKRYMGLRSWLRTGNLINAEFAYHTVPMQYDQVDNDTFIHNPMEFHLVCTDVDTGQPVYHRLTHVDDEQLEWIRASCSMPLVSVAVPLDGRKLLDGGISDSIPLRYFQSQGYERNIVILTQPKGYFKKRTKLMPIFRLFCKYPAIVRAMDRRWQMYNEQLRYIDQQAALGNTLLLYPERPLSISRTCSKASKLKEVYAMGRKVGLDNYDRIIEFLKK